MNNPQLTLSSIKATGPTEPPVIVVVEIEGTQFGIDLRSVVSIAMPLAPVRYEGLPPGVAGVIHLHGETIPALAARDMLVAVGEEGNSVIKPVFASPYHPAPHAPDSRRMLVLTACGVQAALGVDHIVSISPDVSLEQDGSFAHPAALLGLLASGCIDGFAVTASPSGGEFRGVALVDVEALVEACCPVGGIDDLRRAQRVALHVAQCQTATGGWRAQRNSQNADRRAA